MREGSAGDDGEHVRFRGAGPPRGSRSLTVARSASAGSAPRMRVVECESLEAAAEQVAGDILAAVAAKPDLVLGLATGSTPYSFMRH